MTEPLISVIMPAYNAELYIEEAILSVIAQTYSNWELLVINDGSTDNTGAIALEFISNDNRIKLLNQQNKKLSAARNTGIKVAKGKWIAFLDADDMWLPEKLTLQVQAINNNPTAGVIYTDGYVFIADNIANILPYGTISGVFNGAEMYKLEYQGNYIPVLSALVKKQHLDKVGLQDEQLRACEDWDQWLRLALHDVGFYGMPEKLFYYRKHAANMSNNDNLMRFSKAVVFIKNFRKELFNCEEISRLKSFINITICHLVKTGEVGKALILNTQRHQIAGNNFNKISGLFINVLKSRSYLPVRLIFKADTLLSKLNRG